MKPDHITVSTTEYISLAQHQRVLNSHINMDIALQQEACSMGTPSQCLITIAELATLLDTKSLEQMIAKVEILTGRNL